jgi:hypothetical protein
MDFSIIFFSMTAGVICIVLLELIRRFIMSEPQGKRTVRKNNIWLAGGKGSSEYALSKFSPSFKSSLA